ncbi:GNAT family N-acetyltransferase [Paenibacillus sambharensis]|uniref:GNAT family N-acetyltransferase n=1 Tax=Paenibacillus sambharensis TaxID=1803190 RepID=UPI001FEC8AE3|nr:GNAT family N-acetyltransferase [Paenibacillus sambharensis]
MNQEIVVRRAVSEDAESLMKLNYDFNGVLMDEEEVRKRLTDSRELVVLGTLDGIPVGFACAQYFQSFCYRNLMGEITEMYVSEEVRRRGLASLMISFIERELLAMGVTSLKILTGKKTNLRYIPI